MTSHSISNALKNLAVVSSALAMLASGSAAHAAVLISSAATANMTCTDGVCTPSKKSAVLNVSQLQSMLASGSVTVTTAGAKASDILVTTGVSWVSGSTLTLDAYHSLTVNKTISVAGTGGFAVVTNDGGTGGTFSFGAKGNVNFWSLSDALTINGAAYSLVGNIAALASDITSANGAGFYALANSYNAQADGTYSSSPIATTFTGNLEGLGNTISHLAIVYTGNSNSTGLFSQTSGTIENLNLSKETISVSASGTAGGLVGIGHGQYFDDTADVSISGCHGTMAGGLVGQLYGSISGAHVSGKLRCEGEDTAEGGLVGESLGNITDSYATASVTGTKGADIGGLIGYVFSGSTALSYATGSVSGTGHSAVGGLIGQQGGTVSGCYATGAVSAGSTSDVGGLTGEDYGAISNSYALGGVTGGPKSNVGGLIGFKQADTGYTLIVSGSYSTGLVTGGVGSVIGGFIGVDNTPGQYSEDYWDTTTSGIAGLSQGAGNRSNDAGMIGQTTTQLQSGLPAGFSNSIWGESSNINGGLPYLLALPPS